MLKTALSICLLALPLLAAQLQKSYEVEKLSLYSTDLIPSCDRNFFLFKIPRNRQVYQHPAHEIVQAFERFGCEVDAVDFARVTFNVSSNTQCLEEVLQEHFTNLFPGIGIESIYIANSRFFDCDQEYEILSIPNRPKSTFTLVQGGKKYFMRYEVEATLPRYVAQRDIARGQSVDRSNVAKEAVPLENNHKEYIQSLQNSVARYRITQGSAITQNMVEQKPDVKRGHTIKCRFKQDNIIIEFDATALSDGVAGDEIRVQKGLEIYKAKILAKNLVEIL